MSTLGVLAAYALVFAVLGVAVGLWALAPLARANLVTAGGRRVPQPRIRLASALVTAVVWGVLAWRVVPYGGVLALAPLLVFVAAATVLTIVDLAEKRLPNAVIGPALAIVGVLLVLLAALSGRWFGLLWALLGAVVMFAIYLLLAVVVPGAMGMGDVKLAALIGALLGWYGLGAWLVGLLAAFVIGGVVSLVALALRRVTLKGSIPFGPSMLAGALVAVVLVT